MFKNILYHWKSYFWIMKIGLKVKKEGFEEKAKKFEKYIYIF